MGNKIIKWRLIIILLALVVAVGLVVMPDRSRPASPHTILTLTMRPLADPDEYVLEYRDEHNNLIRVEMLHRDGTRKRLVPNGSGGLMEVDP